MKKFFKSIGKKSNNPETSSTRRSSNASATSTGSYNIVEKEKDLPKIHRAIVANDVEKVSELAKKEVKVTDKLNRTPLHLTCALGHASMLSKLFEWNANPKAVDKEGCTPLIKAAQCPSAECVKIMLKYHADVNAQDNDGQSSLHYAAAAAYQDVVQALIASPKININAKNKLGQTAVFIAVVEHHPTIVNLLADAGADVDAAADGAITPLMQASLQNDVQMVRTLMLKKADYKLKDASGLTADDHAAKKGNVEVRIVIAELSSKSAARSPVHKASSSAFGAPAANVSSDVDEDDIDVGYAAIGGETPRDVARSTSKDKDKWSDSEEDSSAVYSKVKIPKLNLLQAMEEAKAKQDAARDAQADQVPPPKMSARSQSSDSWRDDTSLFSSARDPPSAGKVQLQQLLAQRPAIAGDNFDDEDGAPPPPVPAKKLDKIDNDFSDDEFITSPAKPTAASAAAVSKPTTAAAPAAVKPTKKQNVDDDFDDFSDDESPTAPSKPAPVASSALAKPQPTADEKTARITQMFTVQKPNTGSSSTAEQQHQPVQANASGDKATRSPSTQPQPTTPSASQHTPAAKAASKSKEEDSTSDSDWDTPRSNSQQPAGITATQSPVKTAVPQSPVKAPVVPQSPVKGSTPASVTSNEKETSAMRRQRMKAELGLKDDSDEESDSISSPPIMLSAHGDSSPVKAKPAEPKPVIPIVAKSQQPPQVTEISDFDSDSGEENSDLKVTVLRKQEPDDEKEPVSHQQKASDERITKSPVPAVPVQQPQHAVDKPPKSPASALKVDVTTKPLEVAAQKVEVSQQKAPTSMYTMDDMEEDDTDIEIPDTTLDSPRKVPNAPFDDRDSKMAPQPSRQLSTVTSAVTEVSNVNDFDDSSVDGEDGGLSSRSTSIQHLLAQSGDSSANFSKAQEKLRDMLTKLERERNARVLAENRHKKAENEKLEVTERLEELARSKTTADRFRSEQELKIRNLEDVLKQDKDNLKHMEEIANDMKAKLAKSVAEREELKKVTSEMELSNYSLQEKVTSTQIQFGKIQEEKAKLEKKLSDERKLRQDTELELDKTRRELKDKNTEISTHVSTSASTQGQNNAENDMLNARIRALESELEQVKKHQREDESYRHEELDEAMNKIEGLSEDVSKLMDMQSRYHSTIQQRLRDEGLTRLSLQVTHLEQEREQLKSSLKRESNEKDELKAERDRLRMQLDTAKGDLLQAQSARSLIDSSRREKGDDEWQQLCDKQSAELRQLRDDNQNLTGQLSAHHITIGRLESELQITKDSQAEKNRQLLQLQKDLDEQRAVADKLRSSHQKAVEENIRLKTRAEADQERIQTLKADGEQSKAAVDELRRKQSVSDRDEMSREHLSAMLTAQRVEADRFREHSEREIDRLQLEVEKAKSALAAEAGKHAATEQRLNNELDRAKQEAQEARLQLAATTTKADTSAHLKDKVEGKFQQVKVESAKLETELKHEKEAVDKLQKEVAELKKEILKYEEENISVRKENLQLRNEINELRLKASAAVHDMEEHKSLWEAYTKTQAKLSQRITQLEKEKEEAVSQLEEEKLLVTIATEQKKIAESQMLGAQEKLSRLQTDYTKLKTIAKKKNRENGFHNGGLHETNDVVYNNGSYEVPTFMKKSVGIAELEAIKAEVQLREQQEFNRRLEAIQSVYEQQMRSKVASERGTRELDNEHKQELQRQLDEHAAATEKLKRQIGELIREREDDRETSRHLRDLYESESRRSQQLAMELSSAAAHPLLAGRIDGPVLPPRVTIPVANSSRSLPATSDLLSGLNTTDRLRSELDRTFARHLEKSPQVQLYLPPRPRSSSSAYGASYDYVSMMPRSTLGW